MCIYIYNIGISIGVYIYIYIYVYVCVHRHTATRPPHAYVGRSEAEDLDQMRPARLEVKVVPLGRPL